MKAPSQNRAIPGEIRILLTVAGWLLPRSPRREWSREWLAEFSHVFPAAGLRRKMFTRAAGAVADAWTLLQFHGIRRRLSEAAHSRLTPVVLPALLCLALALGTNGLQRARELLFHAESENLVLLVYPIPFMGWSSPIPVAQADRWLRTGSTAAALGAWIVERRVWKPTPEALELFGQSRLRPQYDRIEISGSPLPQYAGIVAKLRTGATVRQAEAELAETAKFQKGWQAPVVVSLASIRRAPLLPIGLWLVFMGLVSALSVRFGSLRAGIYALAPVCLCFAAIAGAWVELVARAPVTEIARIPPAWNLLLYVMPAVAASFVTWLFRRRAPRRCRMCYRPLMPAVSVGMEGRCIFEPGGSEYLCADGHGALVVGFAAQHKADEVWTSWSGSWA